MVKFFKGCFTGRRTGGIPVLVLLLVLYSSFTFAEELEKDIQRLLYQLRTPSQTDCQ